MQNQSTQVVDLSNLTTEQLQEALKKRQALEMEEQRKARTDYEAKREELIDAITTTAGSISRELASFKKIAIQLLTEHQARMLQYGDIKGGEKNKGNFEVKNDRFKIIYRSQIKKAFDERSLLAEQKLKEFLSGFVRKRDGKLYKLILGLLERNSITGDLDISNINRLYKMENEFDSPEWKEAIKLFKESYNPTETATYINIYQKTEEGKWVLMNLNWSAA